MSESIYESDYIQTLVNFSLDAFSVDQVSTFCDNSSNPETQHNEDADTMQNSVRGCNGKSTKSVILDHEDFKDGND